MITVTVVDAAGRPVREVGLARWLARAAPRRAKGAVTVALVSDARMRALNRQFRKKNYPTDVLSFPVDPAESGVPGRPGRRPALLGEIAIARGVARRQARRYGHKLPDELKLLALHGLLHLLGYDHETDTGQMAELERRLRRKGGLTQSLGERVCDGERSRGSGSRTSRRRRP